MRHLRNKTSQYVKKAIGSSKKVGSRFTGEGRRSRKLEAEYSAARVKAYPYYSQSAAENIWGAGVESNATLHGTLVARWGIERGREDGDYGGTSSN